MLFFLFLLLFYSDLTRLVEIKRDSWSVLSITFVGTESAPWQKKWKTCEKILEQLKTSVTTQHIERLTVFLEWKCTSFCIPCCRGQEANLITYFQRWRKYNFLHGKKHRYIFVNKIKSSLENNPIRQKWESQLLYITWFSGDMWYFPCSLLFIIHLFWAEEEYVMGIKTKNRKKPWTIISFKHSSNNCSK